jgi:hypothetical protein
MTHHSSLRHFVKGVLVLSQTNGTEHKNMEKVIVGAIAGAVPHDALCAACALIDFIYYAYYPLHTEDTLAALSDALQEFHNHKDTFIQAGVRKDFNVNKIHWMLHYVDAIRSRGTADNFNTEQSECLHIEFAKKGYRASNRREYTKQMVLWLQQQESTILFDGYLNWAVPDFMLTALDALSDTDKEISPSIAPIRTSINDKIAVRYDTTCYYLPKSPPQSGVRTLEGLSRLGCLGCAIEA